MAVKRGSRNVRRRNSRKVTKNLVRRKRVKRTVGRRRGGGFLKSLRSAAAGVTEKVGSAAADAGKRAAERSMKVAKDAGKRAAERSMKVAKDAGRRSMEVAKDAGTRAAVRSMEVAKNVGNMAVEKTLEGAQMVGEKLAKGAQERLENRTVETPVEGASPVEAAGNVEEGAPTGGRRRTRTRRSRRRTSRVSRRSARRSSRRRR